MSMLAEKKRRVKLCLNPCGKLWSEDKNKFGQKILEKMGWKEGQGLGANNQGLTDIVRVRQKDDNKGLGFKENGEEWLKTTCEYNELLDKLGNAEEKCTELMETSNSLEDRSKSSKARVHYHKFTRGKDLSKYSEKDLASIIGPDVVKQQSKTSTSEGYSSNHIVKGTSDEYFKNKVKQNQLLHNVHFQEVQYSESKNSVAEVSSKKKKQNVLETYIEGKNKSECFENCVEANKESTLPIEIATKKKKKKVSSVESCIEEESKEGDFENSLEMNEDPGNEVVLHKKKKKRKVPFEEAVWEEEILVDSLGKNHKISMKDSMKLKKRKVLLDELHSNEETEEKFSENCLQAVEGSKILDMPTKKKKKKKKTAHYSAEEELKEDLEHTSEESNTVGQVPPNKKKKHAAKLCFKEEKIEELLDKNLQTEDNSISKLYKSPKKTKKMYETKQERNEYNEEESPIIEINKSNKTIKTETENIPENNESSKKSKKLKNKSNSLEENVQTCYEQFPQGDIKIKSQKKGNPGKTFIKNENSSSSKIVEEASEKFWEVPNLGKKTTKEKYIKEEKGNNKNGCEKHLSVLGRPTRIKKINKCFKKDYDTYKTEDFISLNSEGISKSLDLQEKKSEIDPGNTKLKIHVGPQKNKNNMPKRIVFFEYRLLRDKVKDLNLVIPEIKVVVEKAESFADKRKMKVLEKIKQLKSLLPPNELAAVEESVNLYLKKLEPGIKLMDEILKIETKVVQISKNRLSDLSAGESMFNKLDSSIKIDANTVEILKSLLNELDRLSKENNKFSEESNENKIVGINQEKCYRTNVEGVRSENKTPSLNGEIKTSNITNEEGERTLHCRISEKLKILTKQINLLLEGKSSDFIALQEVGKQDKKQLEKFGNKGGKTAVFKKRDKSFKKRSSQTFTYGRSRVATRNSGSVRSGLKRTTLESINEPVKCEGVKVSREFGRGHSRLSSNFQLECNPPSTHYERGRGMVRGFGRGHVVGRQLASSEGRGTSKSLFATQNSQRGYNSFRGIGSYRGRGRGVEQQRQRGRISQTNYDARTYAEKCKSQNKVPELSFNGVDLKQITGYASSKSVQENFSKKQVVLEVAKKSTEIGQIVVEKQEKSATLS